MFHKGKMSTEGRHLRGKEKVSRRLMNREN